MRKGDTILFEAPPSAVAYAAVGGKKEAEGPLADAFDMLIADTQCGEKTWDGNGRGRRHPGSGRGPALCARRHIRPRAGL